MNSNQQQQQQLSTHQIFSLINPEMPSKTILFGREIDLLKLLNIVSNSIEDSTLMEEEHTTNDTLTDSINWSKVANELSEFNNENTRKMNLTGVIKRIFFENNLDLCLRICKGEQVTQVMQSLESTQNQKDRDHEKRKKVLEFNFNSATRKNLIKHPQINPDDDGKDEKYLQGGWQNRLSLGLKSGLPNEVDWAFQKLIKLSYQHYFFIGYLPGLLEGLPLHLDPFFSQLTLKTNAAEFSTTLNGDATLCQYEEQLFSQESALIFERTLQALHVLRNISFMHENATLLARNHKLLLILAKGMALPFVSHYIEVQQHCLDIFENIAHLIALRGQKDFFLACLKKMIYDSDRAKILGGLRSLVKLCLFEKNIHIIIQVETSLIQRMLQLLLVPDEDIVMIIMEFLYLYTNVSPENGAKLASSVRFNILSLLFKFLYWKGQGIEAFHATIDRRPLPVKTAKDVQKLKIPPPNLPPNAVPHFYAAMWLQSVCEKDPAASLSYIEFYDAYLDYSGKNDLEVISQPELLKLVVKIVGDACISSQPPLILGLKPPTEEEEEKSEEQGQAMDIDDTSTQRISGLKCGINNCPEPEFETAEELLSHIPKHGLLNEPGLCPWLHCNRYIRKVATHVLTHVPYGSVDLTPKPQPAPREREVVEELKGIQLTALLVIRNIARHPQNGLLFAPYEKELAGLLTCAKYSKTVSMVFAELGKVKKN